MTLSGKTEVIHTDLLSGNEQTESCVFKESNTYHRHMNLVLKYTRIILDQHFPTSGGTQTEHIFEVYSSTPETTHPLAGIQKPKTDVLLPEKETEKWPTYFDT